jgi:Transposase DDE domain group 1
VRLIVRRVRPPPGSQLALFCADDYHPFITDRAGPTLELEADHRRHAEVEPAICDLKHGAGLQHLPSGRFAANAAWLALCAMAYNLARWTTRLGVGEVRMSPKTLRVRYLALPGRLAVSARRPTLHLPARWPWRWRFQFALARLRCIPHPT